MDARMETRIDALLRRLDVPSSPDDGFVSASMAELMPYARRARAQDRSRASRLLRDLRLAAADLTSRTATRSRYALAGVSLFVLIAVLLALLLIVVGSQRRLPAPFGFAVNGQIAYAADGHVYLADPLGANRRQVTFDAGQQADPTFSRDGTRLSWRQFDEGGEPGTADVVLANADGSHQVVIAGSVAGLSHIAWSPDSRFVAFSGSIDGGPGSGWIAPADGSAPPAAFTSIAGAWDPTWSPDGQRLLIGADPGGLYVVDRDGGNPRRLNKADFEEVGQRGEVAEWTPAGTLVLFTAIVPGGEQQVYLVGLDGARERRLSDAEIARDASWSPDGSEIAYMQKGTGTGPIVFITDVTGLHFRTLPGHYGWYQPIWSPDGRHIVVTDDRPGPSDEPGPAVRVILDAAGKGPPVEIPAAGVTPELVPDWPASWQRLAP
jgi:Tol biopolymer transport system component